MWVCFFLSISFLSPSLSLGSVFGRFPSQFCSSHLCVNVAYVYIYTYLPHSHISIVSIHWPMTSSAVMCSYLEHILLLISSTASSSSYFVIAAILLFLSYRWNFSFRRTTKRKRSKFHAKYYSLEYDYWYDCATVTK